MYSENTEDKLLPVVGITMGDPAGIGPELCLRILRDDSVLSLCTPAVFGDEEILNRVAKCCKLSPPPHTRSLEEWKAKGITSVPLVIDCAAIDASTVRPGKVSPNCGKAAQIYIEASVEAALSGKVDAITTAPVNKEAFKLAEIPYPGHTELLAALTGSKRVCMMLVSEDIAVSMVTTHIGYSEVSAKISSQRILEVIELTAEALARVRNKTPRIVVCGLNPHAGEQGLFGCGEEQSAIEPAIAAARAQGIDVEGPLPPDTTFIPQRRQDWDAAVCMYHDQGHIPFKMLAFDTGVNITLGMPIVRTSVDHGTAFDIAWKGQARWESMAQAVSWAIRLTETRVRD